jgi:hypothetical protein
MLDSPTLVDPGETPLLERTAVGLLFKGAASDPSGILEVPFEKTKWSVSNGRTDQVALTPRSGTMPREWAALMLTPPDFMQDAIARTRGAFSLLRDSCASIGAKLVIVPIPSKPSVQRHAGDALRAQICLRDDAWDANQPLRTFLDLAHSLGIPALDSTEVLRGVAMTPERVPGDKGEPSIVPDLYFQHDWHFNPRGNLEFAHFLRDQLDVADVGLPLASGTPTRFVAKSAPTPTRHWPYVFGGLWLFLTALYYGNYPKEPKWQPPLKVFGMLAAIFTIFLGVRFGMGLVPSHMASKLIILFVLVVLGFVAWKLGRRIATILELSKAFVLRGHWYLMPLLVVLLSIGSLLVVAASSPLIAPFIYTLF